MCPRTPEIYPLRPWIWEGRFEAWEVRFQAWEGRFQACEGLGGWKSKQTKRKMNEQMKVPSFSTGLCSLQSRCPKKYSDYVMLFLAICLSFLNSLSKKKFVGFGKKSEVVSFWLLVTWYATLSALSVRPLMTYAFTNMGNFLPLLLLLCSPPFKSQSRGQNCRLEAQIPVSRPNF